LNLCITISETNWSLTKDVVSIFGTIGALTIGGLGLFTWNRQLRGTSEYEIAKKAILKTYERMTYLNEKWAELQTIRLEAKVIWGKEAEDSFNEIQQRIGNVRGAIWLHFWLKGAYAGPRASVDNSPERIIENDKVVYFTSDEDEFSQK